MTMMNRIVIMKTIVTTVIYDKSHERTNEKNNLIKYGLCSHVVVISQKM
jgi:hypothetical protein